MRAMIFCSMGRKLCKGAFIDASCQISFLGFVLVVAEEKIFLLAAHQKQPEDAAIACNVCHVPQLVILLFWIPS